MNFRTIFPIGLCSALLLVGCSDPERETLTKMKAHLTGKAPEFRNIDGNCGQVSYVDSSGKRSEYKHFITYDDKYYSIQIEGVKDPLSRDFKDSWSGNCRGDYISPTDKAAFAKCASVVKTYAANPSQFEYYPNKSTNFSNSAGRQVVTLSFVFGDVSHRAECVISPTGITKMTQMW